MRDAEQTRLTDEAYSEALRLIAKHRALLDRVASALLEKETLNREELLELFGDVGAGVTRRATPSACRRSSPPTRAADPASGSEPPVSFA